MMKCCTYDNPKTMQRECWREGELLCSYSFEIFYQPLMIPSKDLFFGANIGPWKAGQIVGNKEAMGETN